MEADIGEATNTRRVCMYGLVRTKAARNATTHVLEWASDNHLSYLPHHMPYNTLLINTSKTISNYFNNYKVS